MWTPLDLISTETWIIVASIVALVWYYVHRKWQYFYEMNIPHDAPSIFKFGHLRDLRFSEKSFSYDNEMKKKHGPIWGSYIFLSPAIVIHDPEILRQILIKEFHSFPLRRRRLTKVGGKEMNTGLTTVEGNQWKRIRSSMTPTFSASKLRQMNYITERCVDNAIAALHRRIKNDNGVFSSKSLFSRLSLDVICSAAFSTDVNSLDDSEKEPEISKHVKALLSASIRSPIALLCRDGVACNLLIDVLSTHPVFFPPIEKVIAYFNLSVFSKDSLEYFKALTHHIITQRETTKVHRVDLMQLMLNGEISEKSAQSGTLQTGMDRNEITGNALLVMLAGYENTGNTMSFLAYNLAQHPEVQRKLREEIDEIIKRKGKIDYDSVGELKYLDMCINESLRIYNPVLRNTRLCTQEITINGLTIPKGMTVNIPAFALSHDPEYWDNPEVFDPERMRDMTQIDPMVFQPFGAGPRNCIGLRFALIEIKMSIARIVHQFNLEPAENTPKPPLKLSFGLSVRHAVDYDLRVVRRN